ncbi:MAG: cobalamin-binding protein [bacterium]
MKRGATTLVFFAVSAALAARPAPPAAADGKRAAPPRRVISLAPSMTEIVFFLGLGDRLVGVTTQCDYPPEAKKIEKVGGYYMYPSLEKIVALKPDIILAETFTLHPLYQKMKKMGLPLVNFSPETVDDVLSNIEEIGAMLGASVEAKKRTAGLRARVETIEDRCAKRKLRPRVYIELWYDPVMTVGSRSFIADVLRTLQSENIFDDIDKGYVKVNNELIIARDPEVIILAYMKAEQNRIEHLLKRPGWDRIRAVREGRVFADVNPDLYLRPGPRIAEGLEALEERIHGSGGGGR